MKRGMLKRRVVSLGLAGCLLLGTVVSVFTTKVQAAGVSVDGDLADWGSVPRQDSMDESVPYWSVAQDAQNLYFSGHDRHGTDWYRPLAQQTVIFTYVNNAGDGSKDQIVFSVEDNNIKVVDYWWNDIPGSAVSYRHVAGTSEQGNMERDYEWSIPKSILPDTEYSIKFCGVTVALSDIPQLNDVTQPGTPDVPETKPAYQGIVIDGKFADWDAIEKTPYSDGKNPSTLDEVAMVWDGDTIYLYFMTKGNGDGTGNWKAVTTSGPFNSGQFSITTDLGKTLLVQLSEKDGGSVTGVDGAKVAVNNGEWAGAPHMWEVSIPASALPAYKDTISFGIYQGKDPIIKDVANLQGNGDTEEEVDKNFNGIVIDGLYGDWEYYPHTLIQYATQGTHHNRVDGEAALHSANGVLYAHVVSEMKTHVQEAGGEFTEGVLIRLNREKEFMPQVIAVDAQGNIDYSPQKSGLQRGTYEFYLIDAEGWKTAQNISELEEQGNGLYGHMYVTVGAGKDEMEFEMDLEMLAKKFGMEAEDIKTIEARWRRIGEEWVTTAGTSTGTWVGLLLCFAGVGAASVIQRRRRKHAK